MKSKFCFCAARLEERRRRRGDRDIEQILRYQSLPVLVSDPFTEDYQRVSKHLRPRDIA
jgi:hypothetical protein